MTHSLTIDPGGSETVYDAGKLSHLKFNRQHTALGWWSVRAPFDLSLEDHLGDEIHLVDGSELLFRGVLLDVENTVDRGDSQHSSLAGKGIGFLLTSGNAERRVTNTPVADEIETVWGLTSFDATVTAPTANTSTADEVAQEANTTAEFSAISSAIADNIPLKAQNTNIELLQTCFTTEAEDETDSGGTGSQFIGGFNDLSEGEGWRLADVGDFVTYTFTTDYTIPADDFDFAARYEITGGSDSPRVEVTIDSELIAVQQAGQGGALLWRRTTDGDWDGQARTPTSDLEAGTHEVRFEVTEAGTDTFDIDVIAPNDTGGSRFTPNYNFDNTLDANQGALDGPELYPDQVELELDTASTTWSVNQASVSSTWNNTSGNQRIQLQLPPDGTWGGSSNSSTITDFAFGSDAGTAINGRARFSRFGTQSVTPKEGISGQKLQSWEITFDGDDVPVITDKTYEGSVYQILRELHDEGRMHWTIEHSAASPKTVESYPIDSQEKADPGLTVLKQTRSKSLEKGYANSVTVRGAKDDDGNRIKKTVEDASQIATFGKVHKEFNRPTADTQTEVDRLARQILRERVQNAEIRGRQEIVPKNVAPGYSYPVTWSDGSTDIIPAELVSYEVRGGDLIGLIEYDLDPRTLAPRLSGAGQELRQTQLAF